jgi:hypothetical protein
MITVLGKGGYAKVVLIRKNEDGNLFALKILKKKFIGILNDERTKKTNRSYNYGKKRTGASAAPVHSQTL